MGHARICRETGKRIHPSIAAARKASRGPHRLVRVERCEHCAIIPLKASQKPEPRYHVVRRDAP